MKLPNREIKDAHVMAVITGFMENYPEAGNGSTVICRDFDYENLKFKFLDTYTGKEYDIDKEKLLTAFPLMFTEKWPRGCTRLPQSDEMDIWEDWLCECDAQDHDAFVQLACLGEVIYG